MYDPSVVATDGASLTLDNHGSRTTVDLYSQPGLELVAALWLKLSAQYRLMYEPNWLGVPVIQLPSDIIAMQELIWRLRPDFIVECGFAHGGSAVLYSSLCQLAGKGSVISVDIDIRRHNRIAVETHPFGRRIRMIEGDSADPATFEQARRAVTGGGTVMVALDSCHDSDHVLRELDLYHQLVTPGSYLVVMDGAQAHVWDIPRAKPGWKDSNPLLAIDRFLASHPEFEIDEHFTRHQVTCCPRGFLRRRSFEQPGV